MPGIVASILRRLKGRDQTNAVSPTVETTGASGAPSPDENRLRDRALVEALDRAMGMGQWEHAKRVARTALRVWPQSARLTERLARLAMIDGDPGRALQLIDRSTSGGTRDTALRLLRAGCLVQLGRRDRAHVDLLRWSRHPAAPLEARMMLALLEWDGADPHAASLALLRNLRNGDDPRTIELLTLIAAAQARTAKAREWADRLTRASAFGAGSPHEELLLCSLQLPPGRATIRPTAVHVQRLARELLSNEEVIPALVEAQRIRPNAEIAELLEQALARALPAVIRPALALESLTRLAMIRGDQAAARRWAERGLAANPLSAALSIMHRALLDDEERERAQETAPDAVPTVPAVLATIGHDDQTEDPQTDIRGQAA